MKIDKGFLIKNGTSLLLMLGAFAIQALQTNLDKEEQREFIKEQIREELDKEE